MLIVAGERCQAAASPSRPKLIRDRVRVEVVERPRRDAPRLDEGFDGVLNDPADLVGGRPTWSIMR